MTELKFDIIIAHRGDRAFAPENTLAAIRQAAKKGAKWVEFDATLTKDAHQPVVIFHDERVGRTTNLKDRLLTDVSFAELRAADAGSWFSESFAGEQVPTLKEVIALCDQVKINMNIEIKVNSNGDRDTPEPFDDKLAELTARRVIEDVLEVRNGNWKHIMLSSLSSVALLTAARIAPDAPLGFKLHKMWPDDNFEDRLPVFSQRIGAIKPQAIGLNQELLSSQARVAKFNSAMKQTLGYELPLFAYTVNDTAQAKKLQEWGIYGLFTDRPGELLNPPKASDTDFY